MKYVPWAALAVALIAIYVLSGALNDSEADRATIEARADSFEVQRDRYLIEIEDLRWQRAQYTRYTDSVIQARPPRTVVEKKIREALRDATVMSIRDTLLTQ